jgi:hypothetical protein
MFKKRLGILSFVFMALMMLIPPVFKPGSKSECLFSRKDIATALADGFRTAVRGTHIVVVTMTEEGDGIGFAIEDDMRTIRF